jgi:hypothetical protein
MAAQATKSRITELCQLVSNRLTVPWTATTTPAQLCSLCSDCDDDRITACLIANWAFAGPDRDECVKRAAEIKSCINAGEICFQDQDVRNHLLMPLLLFEQFPDVDKSNLLRGLHFTEQEEAEVESRGEEAGLPFVRELINHLHLYHDALTGTNSGLAVPATTATHGQHTIVASQGHEQSAALGNESVDQSGVDDDSGAPGETLPEQQPVTTGSPAPAPTAALRKFIVNGPEFATRKKAGPTCLALVFLINNNHAFFSEKKCCAESR